MSRRLILLRHGQTEYNATRRMQGQLDTELSSRGVEQAKTAARYLKNLGIEKIVSSDLERARNTALAVAEEIGLEITTDPRLRETHLGDWQGKTHEEVDTAHPGARAKWRHDPTWAPPGGESRVDVAKRTREVVEELMAEHDGWNDSTVLFVAHGGAISALTSNLLDLALDQYPMISGLGNTCWAQLTARPVYDTSIVETLKPHKLERSPSFEGNEPARWYLDAWNMGVYTGE